MLSRSNLCSGLARTCGFALLLATGVSCASPQNVLTEAEAADEEEGEETEAAASDFMARVNPDSLTVVQGLCEPCVAEAENGKVFQFLRTGYFCKDPDSTAETPVYDRTVSLKDSWAKANK